MNEFEQRRLLKEQQREERRRIDLQRLAPEMVPPVAVTDGIRWTLLSLPYPEACTALCEHIREMQYLNRQKKR